MKKLVQVLNIAAFAGTVVVNALAATLPLNGKDTGVLSDQYPTLFVPAGITFAIWGIIYILLAVFAIYQARDLFGASEKAPELTRRIGILFIVASAANMGWIFAWHYEQVLLSLLIMAVLLLFLIAIYLRLDVGRRAVSPSEKFCVHVPFSVYLGWITVATIANTTALLVHVGWGRFGLGETFWTVLVVAVGALITLVMLLVRNDSFYALVVVWAYAGIIIKRTSSPEPAVAVTITAAICAGIVLIGAAIRLPGRLRS